MSLKRLFGKNARRAMMMGIACSFSGLAGCASFQGAPFEATVTVNDRNENLLAQNPPYSRRGLTGAEAAFAKGRFGDSFDASAVEILFYETAPDIEDNGQYIILTPEDAGDFAPFLDGLTRVWQAQTQQHWSQTLEEGQRGRILTLTPQEAALVSGIYGSELDPLTLQKRLSPEDKGSKIARTAGPQQMSFWLNYHSENYAVESDPSEFTAFVHETVHNWQFQNWFRGTRLTNFGYCLPDNLAERRFESLGAEQQGVLLQRYAQMFLHVSRVDYIENRDPQKIEDLRILVETRFPQAKLTREFYLEHGRFPGMEASAADMEPSPARALDIKGVGAMCK